MKSTFLLLVSVLTNFITYSQKDTTVTVYFESNSYEISEIDKAKVIETITSLTEEFSIVRSTINGFCDDVDSDDYNLKLSKNRAEAVAQILPARINESDQNLIINGNGEISLTHLKNLNSETQRTKNRKAEITFHLTPKLPPALKTVAISEPEVEPVEEVLLENEKEEIPSYLEGDLEVGDKILLEGILFEGNEDIILEESIDYAHSLLNELKENPEISVQIQGHIYDPYYYDPNFKSPDTNNLSERRARKIYQFLKKNGIASKRLSYIGFEGEFPLGGDPKFDRRVEIEITELN